MPLVERFHSDAPTLAPRASDGRAQQRLRAPQWPARLGGRELGLHLLTPSKVSLWVEGGMQMTHLPRKGECHNPSSLSLCCVGQARQHLS